VLSTVLYDMDILNQNQPSFRIHRYTWCDDIVTKYTSFTLAIDWSPTIDLLWLIFLLFVNLLHQDSYRTLGELYFILHWLFVCLLYALVSHDIDVSLQVGSGTFKLYRTHTSYWFGSIVLIYQQITVWAYLKISSSNQLHHFHNNFGLYFAMYVATKK
jgi:hypothetical protein